MNTQCEKCKIPDSIEHILYECTISQDVWKIVENEFKCKMNLSSIVLGIDVGKKPKYVNKIREEIISYIAYLLYTYKMKCKNQKDVFSIKNIKIYVVNQLSDLSNVYEKINVQFAKSCKKVIEHIRTMQ